MSKQSTHVKYLIIKIPATRFTASFGYKFDSYEAAEFQLNILQNLHPDFKYKIISQPLVKCDLSRPKFRR